MKLIFNMLAGICLILFISCEKNETTHIETATILDFDLEMATADVEPVKSTTNLSELNFPFSGEGTYKGTSITNIENRLYRIQEVKPHTAPLLSITGISEDFVFHSLQLEWGAYSHANAVYTMEPPIDLLQFNNRIEDGSYKVELAGALIELINNLNLDLDNTIKVKLTGSSNFSLTSHASLEIPVIVESTEINLRFELF